MPLKPIRDLPPELQEAARQARNKYMREWAAKNRDKQKATRERYWMNRARKMLEQQNQSGDEAGETSPSMP